MEEVKITSSEILRPSSDPVGIPESGKLEMSIYDWTMRYAQFQRRILFYSSVHSDQKLMDALKSSLSQALVTFYPMAARISPQSTCFILDCSSLSIQFNQAVTNLCLSDVQDLEFSPSSFCDQLCFAPPWPWSQEDPLLYVQVTKFADHGLSIGIAFSHHLCDGVSAWHFLSSWSQLAKTGKILNPPEISFTFNGINLAPDETSVLGETIGFRRKTDNLSLPSFIPPSELDTRLFKMDSENITKLKETARGRFTTYEVVVAHFWMQIAAARNLPAGKRVQLFLLFNCRQRFGGLTKNYFGNAISMAIVSCGSEALIKGGLGHAAGLLHEAIRGYDERKNQAFLNILDEALSGQGFAEELDVDPEGFSLVVSSPRHPVYECDFGFGRPIGATFGTNDLHEGKIYLFPSPRDPAGVDVRIVLRREQLCKVFL